MHGCFKKNTLIAVWRMDYPGAENKMVFAFCDG